MTTRYAINGLVIESDVSLDPRRATSSGPVDVRVVLNRECAPAGHSLQGDVLAEAVINGTRLYTVLQTTHGFDVVLHGAATFSISAGLDRIDVRAAAGTADELLSVLLNGTVMAVYLMLQGSVALHASAVQFADHAVALVGHSGMGKSTIATLLCSAGGLLVADDLLRVELAANGVNCFAGSTETRLRPAAWAIAGEATGSSSRKTIDGRLALAVRESPTSVLPLRAIFIPKPDRDASMVSVKPLRAAAAMASLLRFPRVLGWTDPSTSRAQFDLLAGLARRIPVGLVTVPWGPPFATDLPVALAEALGA